MKITLKNQELLLLQAELNSLLKTTKDVVLKFYILQLSKAVEEVLTPFETVKNELIKEKGVKNEDDTYSLPSKLESGEDNPAFLEFVKLATEESTIEYKPIPISAFSKAEQTDDVFYYTSKFISF